MKRQPVTPWFPGSIKPVHVGVYECKDRFDALLTYQHWDGKRWGLFAPTPEKAVRYSSSASVRQTPNWRGLASNPKEQP